MWKTCRLIVLCLFIFEKSSTEAGHPSVDLWCGPKEQEVESGQNLTINCVLDSTRNPQTAPCEVEEDEWPECLCGGQDCDCNWTVSSYSSGIQEVAVKINNVTIPGIYNIAIPHTCGDEENDSIKINVHLKPKEIVDLPQTSKPINVIMGAVAVVFVVAIIAAATSVWIRRHRLNTSEASQTKYDPAPQQV